MPYKFKPGEPVQDGLVRIAREQIGRAVDEIDSADVPPHETVHQVRKRCKKVRGLLRLVRPALGKTYARENAYFRDAARQLSGARDARSTVEALDTLLERFAAELDPGLGADLRARLRARGVAAADGAGGLATTLAEVRDTLQDASARAGNWRLDETGFAALRGGLKRTYKRGRKAMAAAARNPRGERFHEWRKRVKYHRYHQRLLRDVWKGVVKHHAGAASELGDLLGDEHDLAALRALVLEAPAPSGSKRELKVLLALIDRRRLTLQQRALPLGQRLYVESPGDLVKRLEGYWQAAALERDLESGVATRLPAFG